MGIHNFVRKTPRKKKDRKFHDQIEKLTADFAYQARRYRFNMDDDDVTDRLLKIGHAVRYEEDDETSDAEGATEATYAERFLALAYIQLLIILDDKSKEGDVVASLCLGNWLVGLLAGMEGIDRPPYVCPSCVIDSYRASIARTGGAGRSAKLEVLRAETIRLYEAGNWKSTPLAAQAITPTIVELSKKEGPTLTPSTTKPLEWIRSHLKSKRIP